MADGGGVVLPGDRHLLRGGHAPGGRGAAVYVDTATSLHSEEEAGQLQQDAEDQKPAANQRRAGHLH